MSHPLRTLVLREGPAWWIGRRIGRRIAAGGTGMSINRTRGTLYLLARLLGDVQAVRKGRVGRRIGRRVVGRATGRGLGRLFR